MTFEKVKHPLKARCLCMQHVLIAVVLLLCTGGAGQKGGFQNIEEDLWNATKDEVSMDMPEAHESAERGQMAQDGLAGASPEDQTTFPSNVEDQATTTTTIDARSSQTSRPA